MKRSGPNRCKQPCGGCALRIARRDFLLAAGAGSLAAVASRLPVMAGPFDRKDFENLVPADKKLDPEWVKSLFARGTPEVLRGGDLKYVGMPIGGICAGQLYLGGDGRIWHWDVFNQNLRTKEFHYAEPPIPASPLKQVFSLTIDGKKRTLDREGFPGVTFRGEYPIGIVNYADPGVPVDVKLEAFSPFIPLNADDSGLPATILEFTIRNTSASPVTGMLIGELENGVCLSNRSRDGILRNRIITEPGLTTLLLSAEEPASPKDRRPDIASEEQVDNTKPFEELHDFGTMTLALLGDSADEASPDTTAPFTDRLFGSLGRTFKLAAGETITATFVIAWHFRNLSMLEVLTELDRYYAVKHASAHAVTQYIAKNFDRLARETRLWRDTWYDSTLPFWFLDRTFLNSSILATSTSNRMENGRYYGWEGVGCCPGTCTHVYSYAHSTSRLFPELERDTRERVDFGLAQEADGVIHFRGEWKKDLNYSAVDGQAGTILRALREHQMSADAEFLKRNWPRIKLATQWLIAKDGNGDGLIEDAQHNTLDTDWFGPVAWLSGMYLAALRAAAQMGEEIGDQNFAGLCRRIADTGRKNLVAQLFDGEYFINKPDPNHAESINSGTGCEIDQMLGQSWAWQVGLPRVLPVDKTKSALQSLWKYNFCPDVGAYRKHYKEGRWYAMAGEAGLLMCTFPRKDWDYVQAKGKGPEGYAGYLNECMNGFEYQVAGHMLWEGMVLEGLAVTRAVHDRYHASRRNPWNEVESGDHYSRSMASYGVYIAACGFEYHGPMGYLAFAPRISPDDFAAAFTAAEGWGQFRQKSAGEKWDACIALRYGSTSIKTLVLAWPQTDPKTAQVTISGRPVPATSTLNDSQLTITFDEPLDLRPGTELCVNATHAI